ncbi:MAG TPA: metalloregulator ArsR/SmtB family transcription factor [Chloroflexota bacterium]|nr:metalloregulator ArsR/SmtB family transcription factor [Chloroflexota bacterium]
MKLLHLLKRTGDLTAPEIARELGITAVAVRKHLARLELDGLVVQHPRPSSRGRPAVAYGISESGDSLFPQGYNQFLVDFLQDLSTLEGDEKLDRLFHLRNERLARTYRLRLVGKPLGEAVRELARARDDDGYMATVEEDAGALVLSEHNCPIYDVAQRFPQVCQCEHELFQSLLKASVTRETTVVDGAASCRYRIAE